MGLFGTGSTPVMSTTSPLTLSPYDDET